MPVDGDNDFQNTCGYFGKCLILILGSAGIALSALASSTCEFLYFENDKGTPYEALEFPFNRAVKAHIGIFSYEVIESDTPDLLTDGCEGYDKLFADSEYEVLIAAQFCALFGPILAGFGLFAALFELCVCSFYCSFLISSLFFLAAAGTQAGTFSLFAEPSFCYEDDSGQTCDVGVGVYLSGAATAAFWIACLLLCCFPRPEPFCKSLGGIDADKSRKSEPKIIFQPVIVNEEPGYDEDYGDEPPSPRRKSSKRVEADERSSLRRTSSKRVEGDEKITKDDFDTPEIGDGTSRVEIKEKTFPDGTRQVDEITHYDDGSKSVKTQTFAPE